MMDHYEELGLDRSASPDEIRQAYKRLVRLLHPDLCSDEPVRQLAELQMKRLNGVLAVLTNPAERANYDRALARGRTLPEFRHLPAVRRALRPGKWCFAALGAVAFLSALPLLLRQGPHPPPAGQLESPPANRAAPAKQPASQPPSRRLRAGIPAGRERLAQANPANEAPEELPPAIGSRPEIEAFHADRASGRRDETPFAAIQPVPSTREPARPTLSGEWLYAPSAHSKDAGLYPPEYIELRVTEDAGILHGRYRARYRITDQAISPTVSFQFAGPAEGDVASLPWIGIGGAKGEVSLRLVDHGALEVTWVATQMGEELGLISGTATLVRRLD